MSRQYPLLRVLVCALLLCGYSAIGVGADKENGARGALIGKDGAPMVLVPTGEFLYGNEKRRLSLPAFYMDKFEVTTKRYAVFMEATKRAAPDRWSEVNQMRDGDRPVIGVNWYEADAYCRYFGKRLPTVQEWDKAARGADGRKYPWGNEEPTSQHANFGKCCDWKGYTSLVPAESYEAGKSPYGIYNMFGNVSEWTSSDGANGSKVLRGGSWLDFVAGLMWDEAAPRLRFITHGFRCAQDAR
ncbi:MAG: hypothetical protein EPO02_07670 [Nitrospirae bacterium]|nr:MAG: hypothetical protein EPO02_07670 [Nitrospirota bacterium]